MERKLAAIFAADVVGYSRLMGRDEAGTLRAINTYRDELFEPKITEYHGRLVKQMGDGMLAEFPSVVEAVQCAVDIQRVMQQRNASVPENRRIEYRIGINLGDIIVDGDDIFGDGVNVAARLESLSEAGGICISGQAYQQIEAKLDFGYQDLGDQTVKNIEKPVRVYQVLIGQDALGTVTQTRPLRPQSWRTWH